jgi:hypothetical protein
MMIDGSIESLHKLPQMGKYVHLLPVGYRHPWPN